MTKVKYLPDNIKAAADKSEHIIKVLSEICVITDEISVNKATTGVPNPQQGYAGFPAVLSLVISEQTIKTGDGKNSRPLGRACLNATDITGLAVPALYVAETAAEKIIMFLLSLLAKANTQIIAPEISGKGF